MRNFIQILILIKLLGHAAAGEAHAPDAAVRSAWQRPAAIPFPADNPYSIARESLGKTLFFDPRLSGSNWISCATCHNPGLEWGDGLAKGLGDGMKVLHRRTPTLLNLAWGELMFWDGRADTLEAQALAPLTAAAEMNMPSAELVRKISLVAGYRKLFEHAYPGEGITPTTLGKAIATYERTLVSGTAPFDRWIEGDARAISPSAEKGFILFTGKARCARCHSSWRFTDESFHDIGVADNDLGRGKILPEIDVLQHAFKTPTLRNIDRRAPYLHDGSEPTLEAVIEFYNQGGKAKRPNQAEDVLPLGLTNQEKADLLEFLKTLTSLDKSVELPILPR